MKSYNLLLKSFFILFLVLLHPLLRAQIQTIKDVSKQLLPPSPTAASLGKYGGNPVTYHTGGATFSVPLYEIKIGSLSLPLSLSYQTGGIKVTDVASRVGLGWTLQGPGIIARTVRGLPDEDTFGWAAYLGANVNYNEVTSVTDPYKIQLIELAAHGTVDSEPDAYYYNFAGHSGKFYFNTDRSVIKVPHNKLIIQGSEIGGFKIIGEDGTEYYFLMVEGTQTNNLVSVSPSYNSSWLITRIVTPKNEEIIFNYNEGIASPTPIVYGFLLSETDYYSYNGGYKFPVQTVANQTIGNPLLTSIETRVEKVVFEYPNARLDLSGDYRLERIKVFSKINNAFTKQFDFNYTYSEASEGSFISNPNFITTSHDYKRLKLLSVSEHPFASLKPEKKYSFKYDSTLLPVRYSLDQDHWGFYNASHNTTLKPRIAFFPSTYEFGNREANPFTVGAESLTEIHYPTGGHTKVQYESHKYVGDALRDSLLHASATITDATPGAYSESSFQIINAANQFVQFTINYHYDVYDAMGANLTLLKDNVPIYTRSLDAVNQINDGGVITTPQISLSAGNYKIRVQNAGDVSGTDISAYVSYYNQYVINRTNYLGGLRIKSLADYTDELTLAKKQLFTYENMSLLNPFAETNYFYQTTEVVHPANCDVGSGTQTYNYTVRTSSNNITMATSLGSPVAYGKVTVVTEGANNGKSTYEYTTEGDLGSGSSYPFEPPTSREHRRGLLKREAHFDQSGTLLKEIINKYSFIPVDSMGAFKVGLLSDDLCFEEWASAGPTTSNFIFGVYKMVGEWIKQTAVEENNYPGPILKKTNLYYDNVAHLQVTRKESLRSDGKWDMEYKLYPSDFSVGTLAIDQLQTKNILNTAIEQVNGIANTDGSGLKITGGLINKFSSLKIGHLEEIDFLELPDPLLLTSFNFSNKATGQLPFPGAGGTFSPFSAYTENVVYDSYDNYGNVTQFHTNEGLSVSIKWGYQSTRPVVFIQNALSAQYYYESFEESGDIAKSHGGKKSWNASWTVPFVRPDGRNYILSYYKETNAGWELVRIPMVSDNPVLTPGMRIDDVFVYPADSDFRLLNYDPSSLLLSDETDNNHLIKYYTYDPLQRLETQQDQNRDIVSAFMYNYKSN